MWQFVQYAGQFQGFRSRVSRLPGWAKLLLVIAAAPGLLLLSLSIVAIVVSVFALLVLTVPVYRLITWLTGSRVETAEQTQTVMDPLPSGRRNIEVKIVE
jgi:hypothetical protein